MNVEKLKIKLILSLSFSSFSSQMESLSSSFIKKVKLMKININHTCGIDGKKSTFHCQWLCLNVERKFHLMTKLLLILLLPQLNDIKIKKFSSFVFFLLNGNFSHILIFSSFKTDKICISIFFFGTMRSWKNLMKKDNYVKFVFDKLFLRAHIIKKC